MKYVVGLILVLLVVLHQDFWNWRRIQPLVFGFIPIGLAWHVGISLAAGFVCWLAVRFCWPPDVDALDDLPEPAERGGTRGLDG